MSRLVLATRESPAPSHVFGTTIADPAEAFRLATKGEVDAVAVRLPVDEALPLVNRLRALDSNLILVVITPDRSEEIKRDALRSGVHAVIRSVGDLEAQVSLLETAVETLQLALVNKRLAQEARDTAKALDEAVREFKRIRRI